MAGARLSIFCGRRSAGRGRRENGHFRRFGRLLQANFRGATGSVGAAKERCLRGRMARRLIAIMFGVTTSDDYKPVTWVGRYPVDVTTLLVAVHAFAMIAGMLPDRVRCRAFFVDVLLFDSAQVLHAAISGRSRPTPLSIRLRAHLVRDRDVHALRLRSRSGTLHRAARLHLALSQSARSCPRSS